MIKKNNRGFSLVELLIAMVILSLIMVSIASFASTTTSTYVRTKTDVELQEDGNDVLNLISDKLMQAQRVRIGTTNNEYTISSTASSGKILNTFYELNELAVVPGSENLEYIAVAYDGAIGDSYGTVADVFYFYKNYLFVFRHYIAERPSAVESTDPDLTGDDMDLYLINYIASDCKTYTDDELEDLKKEHLICDTLEYVEGTPGSLNVDMEAYPEDNSLMIKLNFKAKRSRAENVAMSTIVIRNSYVLSPKGYVYTPPSGP